MVTPLNVHLSSFNVHLRTSEPQNESSPLNSHLSTFNVHRSTFSFSLRPFVSLREKTKHNIVCAHANHYLQRHAPTGQQHQVQGKWPKGTTPWVGWHTRWRPERAKAIWIGNVVSGFCPFRAQRHRGWVPRVSLTCVRLPWAWSSMVFQTVCRSGWKYKYTVGAKWFWTHAKAQGFTKKLKYLLHRFRIRE